MGVMGETNFSSLADVMAGARRPREEGNGTVHQSVQNKSLGLGIFAASDRGVLKGQRPE